MTAVVLCVLALADASFSGFRAHAGRDGRIAKRGAKALAARTGLIAGVIVLFGLAVLLLGLIAVGFTTYEELEHAGGRMALVYGFYALAVTLGFAAYFSPWLEVQSLATMLVLGPGTFVRPAVVVGGAAFSAIEGSWIVTACAIVAAGAMLLIEPVLWRWFDARQAKTMPPFVPPPTRRFSRALRSRNTLESSDNSFTNAAVVTARSWPYPPSEDHEHSRRHDHRRSRGLLCRGRRRAIDRRR